MVAPRLAGCHLARIAVLAFTSLSRSVVKRIALKPRLLLRLPLLLHSRLRRGWCRAKLLLLELLLLLPMGIFLLSVWMLCQG
jgi:hypothetical protein